MKIPCAGAFPRPLEGNFPSTHALISPMREVRAVVLGLFVVLIFIMGINIWRRPGREFRHVRGYRVEIAKTENGSRRHISFHVPMSALARIAKRRR